MRCFDKLAQALLRHISVLPYELITSCNTVCGIAALQHLLRTPGLVQYNVEC